MVKRFNGIFQDFLSQCEGISEEDREKISGAYGSILDCIVMPVDIRTV